MDRKMFLLWGKRSCKSSMQGVGERSEIIPEITGGLGMSRALPSWEHVIFGNQSPW